MTRWDDIAVAFDHVRIRPLCGERITVGYPPVVGRVGLNLTGETLLSDKHLIGHVCPPDGSEWSFALSWLCDEHVLELPCHRRAILGDWIVDSHGPARVEKHPALTLKGTISPPDGKRTYLYNFFCITCYGDRGRAWTSPGLFEGDMVSVQ